MPFPSKFPCLILWLVLCIQASAQYEDFDEILRRAQKESPLHPSTHWETILDHDEADIVTFLGNDSLLLATTEVSGTGQPVPGSILMIDAKTSNVLWRADRPLGNPLYFHWLAIVGHVLVFVSGQSKDYHYYGYSRLTGEKLWEMKTKGSNQVIDGGFMLVNSDSELKKIDLTNSNLVWKTTLEKQPPGQRPILPILLNKQVILIGANATSVNLETGATLWKVNLDKEFANEVGYGFDSDNLLLWTRHSASAINTANGAIKFSLIDTAEFNLNVSWQDGGLLRAYFLGGNRDKLLHIESLDKKTGHRIWKEAIEGTLVSPFHVQGNRVIFSTDESLYALGLENGDVEWRTAFDENMKKFAPNNLKEKGQPDVCRFREDKIFISRELFGLACYSIQEGKQIWTQQNINQVALGNPYYVASAYNMVQANLEQSGKIKPDQYEGNVYNYNHDQKRINPFLESDQRSHDFTMSRTKQVLDDPKSTHADKQMAYEERKMAAGSQIINSELAINTEKIQSSMAVVDALVGLAGVFQEMARMGVISRLQMEMSAALDMQKSCFQGSYHIRPFIYNNLGVTITNLKNGQRCDLIYAPYIKSLDDFSLDLPIFRINPKEELLVTVGVGLNTNNYQKGKRIKKSNSLKWYSWPKSSVLAFRMADLRFSESTPLSETVTGERSGAKVEFPLHTAAAKGDLEEIARLIKSGLSQEQQFTGGLGTPMSFAATMGQNQAILLLLDNGANINSRMDMAGVTPLMMAVRQVHPETVRLLVEKGANPRLKTSDGLTAMDFCKQIIDKKEQEQMIKLLKGIGVK